MACWRGNILPLRTIHEDDRLFPQHENNASFPRTQPMARAGRIYHHRSGAINACPILLGARQDEDVLVADVLVKRHSSVGLVAEERRRMSLLPVPVEPMNCDAFSPGRPLDVLASGEGVQIEDAPESFQLHYDWMDRIVLSGRSLPTCPCRGGRAASIEGRDRNAFVLESWPAGISQKDTPG